MAHTTSTIDGYISLNASHVNQIMKVLTIAAVIIVLLTFLLGNQWHEFREHPGTEIAPRWFPPVERDGHRPVNFLLSVESVGAHSSRF